VTGEGRDLAPIVAVVQEFERRTGRRAIHLGGWEADDPRIGPPPFVTECLATIPPRPGCYAYPREFDRAREYAAEVFGPTLRFDGTSAQAEHFAFPANSTQGIFLILATCRDMGIAHVVIGSPCYYTAVEACRHLGLRVTIVPTQEYLNGALDLAGIVQAASQERSLVFITNPAYSLGVEYAPADLAALAAALPAGTLLMLDETRLGLHWERATPWAALDLPADTIILRSPSKLFFLNGQKSSILCGPADLMRRVERLGEILVGSGAGNGEAIALCYLGALAAWQSEATTGIPGPMLQWKRGVIAAMRDHLATHRRWLAPAGFDLSPVASGPYALAARQASPLSARDCQHIAHRFGVMLASSETFYHDHAAWQGFRLNLAGDAARYHRRLRALGQWLGTKESSLIESVAEAAV
jgi:histidinol-phosphate/aromatic aminotransferase/cobyric acid decarboxylase-like protein